MFTTVFDRHLKLQPDRRIGEMTDAHRPPELVRVSRVVAISPGDVRIERNRLAMVVDELNRVVAPSQGQRLVLWRWETDAHPGLHLEGPQGLIDEQMRIEDADVVVGIFWQRFGTPTGDARSGTEHELRRAWHTWSEHGRPRVMVYFSERKSRPTSAAEARQLQDLLGFREALPKEQFWWSYDKPVDFERAVRLHLIQDLLSNGGARDAIDVSGGGSRGDVTTAEPQLVSSYAYALEVQRDGVVLPDVILPRNSILPAEWRGEFTTISENQKAVSVTVLEGIISEPVQMDDFRRLGVLEVMLPPGLPPGHGLELIIKLDRSMLLTAAVRLDDIPVAMSSLFVDY
jgi:hypothetical protein